MRNRNTKPNRHRLTPAGPTVVLKYPKMETVPQGARRAVKAECFKRYQKIYAAACELLSREATP